MRKDMFVFPLGLQAKTRDFPTVTVLIAVVTTIYSIFSFQSVESIRTFELRDNHVLARMQKQKMLALAACPFSKMGKEDCEILADVLEPGGSESSEVFVDRLLDRVRDSRPSAKTNDDSKAIADSIADHKRATEIARYVLLPEPWRRPSAEVKNLREYSPFAQAFEEEEGSLLAHARDNSLLTRGTFGFKNLVRSLFLHDGWTHLIGNMVFFLLFAIPLESRIGGLALALIYFIGGAFGMTVDLATSHEMARPLLGASACITAVAAAFVVAFWSFSVRVWASAFFVFNHIVRVPTWIFFALFLVIQDLTGVLSAHGDGVAHIAHLGGFGIGLLLGGIATQVRTIPRPFHFPFELDLFLKSRRETNVEKRLGLLREILFYNPINSQALVESWNVVEALPSGAWIDVPRSAKIFLAEHFCDLLIHLQKADMKRASVLLKRIEREAWPAASWIPRQKLMHMMTLIHEFELKARPAEAVILAQALIEADPDSHRTQALRFLVNRGVKHKTDQREEAFVGASKQAAG